MKAKRPALRQSFQLIAQTGNKMNNTKHELCQTISNDLSDYEEIPEVKQNRPNDSRLKEEIKAGISFESLFHLLYPTHWRPNGNYQCPYHDDKDPSFGPTRKGSQNWKCYSAGCSPDNGKKDSFDIFSLTEKYYGCDFKEALRILATKAGLEHRLPKNTVKSIKSRLVSTHPYVDEKGELLFERRKFVINEETGKKKVCPYRPDPDKPGEWVSGLGGERRILYNLPAVLVAKEVDLTEGEKDTDTLNAHGRTATTIPGGALSVDNIFGVHKAHEVLAGKIVNIHIDNDASGEKFGKAAARYLVPICPTVRLIYYKELKHKGDVTDFFELHGPEKGLEKLMERIAAAPPVRPEDVQLNTDADITLSWDNKTFKPDDWADAIIQKHHFYYHGDFYRFNGKHYEKYDSDRVEAIIRELGKGFLREHHCREVLRALHVKLKAGGDIEINPPRLLCLENGLLDLSEADGELVNHSPTPFVTTILPIKLDPYAKCDLWLKMLEELLPDPISRDLLQKYCGYTLTTDTKRQVCLVLQGPGANGKGKIVDVMQAILGPNNYSAIKIEDLNRNFKLCGIQHKLGNFSTELDAGKAIADSIFKGIITGDPITVDRKYKDEVTFQPITKFWILTNHPIETKDVSYGFWRRFMFLEFAETFDPHDPNTDLTIAKKIIEGYDGKPSELSGVLFWCLQGRAKLEKEGFTLPECHDRIIEENKRDADPIIEFAETRLKISTGNQERLLSIVNAYTKHALARNRKPVSDKKIKNWIWTHYRKQVDIIRPNNKVTINNLMLMPETDELGVI